MLDFSPPAQPMYLLSARFTEVPPFGTIEFPFVDDAGAPRLMTLVYGSGGVGKTVLLSVLGATRPGIATVLFAGAFGGGPHAETQWLLGSDDPERPHPLVVATPNQSRAAEDEAAALRRREQALFERRARDGGFVFLALPTNRWFSRQPMALAAPTRTVVAYDVRSTVNLEDANRADLTRETKAALAYAGIASALVPHTQRERNDLRARGPQHNLRALGVAMREAVTGFCQLGGFEYVGVDPISLEPMFTSSGGRRIPFDVLPTHTRHLVAIAALAVRTLWSAYPAGDPRDAEGVIAIDDVDLHQDDGTQDRLLFTMRTTFPHVQWILTTSSSQLAASCDPREILTLRRLPGDERVELFLDHEAQTH